MLGLVEIVFDILVVCWCFLLDLVEEYGVDICYEIYFGEDLYDGIIFEMFLDCVD